MIKLAPSILAADFARLREDVAARDVPGGTAPEQVKRALGEASRRLEVSQWLVRKDMQRDPSLCSG